MTSKIILPAVAGLLATLVLAPAAANAAVATANLAVSANVSKACNVSTTALAFGSYDPLATTDLDGSATMTVNCTTGTSYTIGLGAGGASGATVTARKLTSGSTTLNYGLFQDSGHQTNWGNTPSTDTPAATTATTTAANFTVYGRIPKAQNVASGSYTDTVTVSVNY